MHTYIHTCTPPPQTTPDIQPPPPPLDTHTRKQHTRKREKVITQMIPVIFECWSVPTFSPTRLPLSPAWSCCCVACCWLALCDLKLCISFNITGKIKYWNSKDGKSECGNLKAAESPMCDVGAMPKWAQWQSLLKPIDFLLPAIRKLFFNCYHVSLEIVKTKWDSAQAYQVQLQKR